MKRHTAPGAPTRPGRRPLGSRRVPRFGAFLGTGLLVGIATAAVLMAVSPGAGRYSPATQFGYLSAVLGLVFALVAGLVAVLLDRSRR